MECGYSKNNLLSKKQERNLIMKTSIIKFIENHFLVTISISMFASNYIYNWINNVILIKNLQNSFITVIVFNILYAVYKFMKDGKITK